LDVNGFLLETDKLKADLKGLEEKLAIADSDLALAKESYEATIKFHDSCRFVKQLTAVFRFTA